jgi:putative methionine-R-sulfoxide reductase with GAF domain
MSENTLAALEHVLEKGGEPDDVLRSAVAVLVEEPGIVWVGIAFSEEGRLVLGPETGTPDETRRLRMPVRFQGSAVGELQVDGDADQAFLERVATLISAHVLIGWDTAGEPWEP